MLRANGDGSTFAAEAAALEGCRLVGDAQQRGVEDEMREEPQEYTLAQLVDHPGLGLLMTRDGIERRCIELALDVPNRHRRETESTGDKISGSSV